jgi:UDP-N-acetylmuramoylalanine-D-glutamate ligase
VVGHYNVANLLGVIAALHSLGLPLQKIADSCSGLSPVPGRMETLAIEGRPLVVIDSLSALHAGVKASQGSFSLPFDGWLVQNGERRSIEAATVAGDIRTLLKGLVGFEGDAKVTPDGVCPWVWVDGLSITGEA